MRSVFLAAARVLLVCALAITSGLLVPSLSRAQNGLDNEIQNMDWIGFQQFQEVSRVFVRTTEKVKYNIDTSKPNLVVLVLQNTRVPILNNARHLDTRYFDSPVTYIKPKIIEGPSPSVRIEIRLRMKVPFKETQNDNILALDFQRP
jgi:hypothetical protein